MDQRVGKALFDRCFAPREVYDALFPSAPHVLGKVDHSLGRVFTAVEDDVFDMFEEIFRDVLVEVELSGIHDAHVHAALGRVVEEGCVNCFSDTVIAAKRKG